MTIWHTYINGYGVRFWFIDYGFWAYMFLLQINLDVCFPSSHPVPNELYGAECIHKFKRLPSSRSFFRWFLVVVRTLDIFFLTMKFIFGDMHTRVKSIFDITMLYITLWGWVYLYPLLRQRKLAAVIHHNPLARFINFRLASTARHNCQQGCGTPHNMRILSILEHVI